MNKALRKIGILSTGLLLALTSGAPVLADDTELLLVPPNQVNAPKPNVLFVLDSSGSMTTEENTREIYNSATDYDGDCDDNRLYWSETGVIPSCEDNDKYILKDAFVCDAAMLQLTGIGRYTNIMAQFRPSILLFLGTRWLPLQIGNDDDIVECRKDSGDHGDGSAGLVYAQKGGNVAPFTGDNTLEVAWGSWPLSQAITVFDGNYLNYLQNPVFVDDTRINIVKAVTTAVLNSIENVNVGVMRFNDGQGGPVILGMTDLDTNRAAILAAIDGIDADGVTPLSETLYEAARYWRGIPAYYGEIVDEHPTDPNALASDDPEVYQQPQTQVCAKNFNVVLTDGAPVNDDETPNLVDDATNGLPNWFGALGYAGCDGTEAGRCLDDIAAYLFTDDISPEPGPQLVTTHTIGFSIDLDIMEDAAARSGGTYFQADDVESLTIALLDIVNNIQERSLSFAAPAVAVNTFNRTQNLNDLYMTTFAARETVQWPGNLKKYRILDGEIVDKFDEPAVNPANGFFFDTATSYWSGAVDGSEVEKGGAVENMPNPDARDLFTNNTANNNLTAGTNALSPGNANNFVLSDFGLTGSAEEPTIEEVIRWARGEDITDVDNDPATTTRKFMGDPLHSTPAAVVYGGDAANPDAVVFAATNDGYLHAVDAATGAELWSFIPKELLPNLAKLYLNPDTEFKNYGLDGDIVPVVRDVDLDGEVEPGDGDFVYILFGMRRGGSAFYALDVTNKEQPVLKWRVSEPGFGQSWSTPTVIRMDIDDPSLNTNKAVVVVGGGYDSAHDTITHPPVDDTAGNGIYFLDLETGDVLWRAGMDGAAQLSLPTMNRAFPNQIRVIDINGDNFADRMYASDVAGQIWRFDIFSGKQPGGIGADALVTGGVIAQLGAEGLGSPTDEETRRFYTTPDVSVFNDAAQNRRFIAISIGTGYRAHPLDNTNDDRFYSIRDKDVFNPLSQNDFDTYAIVEDDDLIEIGGTVGTVLGQGDRGWKLTLPANQKVLSTSVTFNNEVFFVTFSPDNAAAEACAAGRGRNFLYRVSVTNGDPVGDLDDIVAGDEDAARVTDLAQGGIAPSPRFLFPSPDDPDCEGEACSPPPLGCVGVECFDPDFSNDPVRTLWTQDGIQ